MPPKIKYAQLAMAGGPRYRSNFPSLIARADADEVADAEEVDAYLAI